MAAINTAQRLGTLQQHLEAIYEITIPHTVGDFLITDAELARQLDNTQNAREVDEKLLVLQAEEAIELALYLDPKLVARLTQDDPVSLLHQGNLVDFCTVLEGISHFLYLTWNATRERSVTCLEMEMQAEVDKYISIATLLAQQGIKQIPERLHSWLFAEPVFDQALSGAELERYRDANHYAGKYCFQLENRYLRTEDDQRAKMFDDLRHFYRLRLRDKIRRIEFEL